MDEDFIIKEEVEIMASELFEKPMISETPKGKGVYVTLAIPTDCSYMWPLYVMAKFDGQLVSRVLVDNGAMLNILPASMLRKLV